MPDVNVYNKSNEIIEEIALPDPLFAGEPKKHLLHSMVRLQLANKRVGTASSKGRSEVAGSTKKLFRQKGTGRARMGSAKSPIRRGGGVVFGPKPRDFGFKLPRKVRRGALLSALKLKADEGNLRVLDNLEMETHKTAETMEFLKKFEAEHSSLLVVNEHRDNLKLGARNIPGVKVLHVDGINVFDILKHEKLLVEKDVLQTLERRFTQK